jgi:hypothetical protein
VYSKSATIIFKTPNVKFYDKGFIEKYDDRVQLTVFDLGTVVLDLTIYEDKICKNFPVCIDSDKFNREFFNTSYEKDFLYKLFTKEDINFKDKEKGIMIKVIYDKEENGENNETKE